MADLNRPRPTMSGLLLGPSLPESVVPNVDNSIALSFASGHWAAIGHRLIFGLRKSLAGLGSGLRSRLGLHGWLCRFGNHVFWYWIFGSGWCCRHISIIGRVHVVMVGVRADIQVFGFDVGLEVRHQLASMDKNSSFGCRLARVILDRFYFYFLAQLPPHASHAEGPSGPRI